MFQKLEGVQEAEEEHTQILKKTTAKGTGTSYNQVYTSGTGYNLVQPGVDQYVSGMDKGN